MEPYSYSLRTGPDGRITQKTETVAGRTVTWKYDYDSAGRLTEAYLDGRLVSQCRYDNRGRRTQDWFPRTVGSQVRNYGYTMDDRLQSAGNNGYTHDRTTGARSIWNHQGQYTTYDYAPDGRLLRAEQEDAGRVFAFDHDEDGRRQAKYENERLVEAYAWQDLIRLAGFHDGEHGFRFLYEDDEARTPYAMQREDGVVASLYFDQVGSLRVIADMQGDVIKETLYDPFGGIIEDTNPDLCIPIGFAGGLHDRDLGFVRFGWRDYDVYTGRWTAPDPMGDGGGDTDWYGYCLDDPVNGSDPLGLFRFGKKKLNGLPWLGALSGSKGSVLDKANLELSHEHGFYEDGSGDNVGLYPEGKRRDQEPGEYKLEKRTYDDKRMRRSENSIKNGKYNACGVGGKKNNCQDYADKLRGRYQLLLRGDNMR